MKKTAVIIAGLIFMAGLFGCGKGEKAAGGLNEGTREEAEKLVQLQEQQSHRPKAEDESLCEEEQEPQWTVSMVEPKHSAFNGVYIRRAEDEPDLDMSELMEIRVFAEMVMMEHSLVIGERHELYDTWAEEFWTDFPGTLTDGSASVEGRSQRYSFMAAAGNYQNQPEYRKLVLEGNTLRVIDDKGDETIYQRTETAGIHTDAYELLERASLGVASGTGAEPAGKWLYNGENAAAYLDIRKDGTFTYAGKKPGETSCVLEGGWTFGQEAGRILMAAEQMGYGNTYRNFALNWAVDGKGRLHLQDVLSEGLPPMPNRAVLEPLEGNWSINPKNVCPFGEAANLYGEE